MSATFDQVLNGLGSKAVDALRTTLKDSWDSFTFEERSACTKLMWTLSKVHLLELAGDDVSDYKTTLEAAFLQWKAVGKQVVVDGIKKVAQEVFGLAGTFAGGALAAFIKGVV